ncbi:hypothetical protein NDA00_04720 [Funiculus sociatus GB2-M2]|uniref:hypothetical protein n=1 Tax=Cyanophyceae TaxID=3028117 RepID=UPI0016859C2B|nr:hypothetical protein [Trichocoleus sp. FACHB-90]
MYRIAKFGFGFRRDEKRAIANPAIHCNRWHRRESVELRELSILLLPVLSVEGIYHKRQIELVELPPDAIACMVAVRG